MEQEILNRNKNINRGFRKLEIWHLAIQLYKLVYAILLEQKSIPFKVKAQIEDSAISISSNIAEGYSRRTLKENLRFYEISLASAAENYSQIYSLFVTGQINIDKFNEYDNLLYELENKILAMNRNLIEKIKSGYDWKIDY